MERTWTHLSLELKALSFQYFSVSPRWLAQWMNSELKSSVLAVDEGAILDAVFENFNHPTPSGFERIMIEKALLWWMSLYVPQTTKIIEPLMYCILSSMALNSERPLLWSYFASENVSGEKKIAFLAAAPMSQNSQRITWLWNQTERSVCRRLYQNDLMPNDHSVCYCQAWCTSSISMLAKLLD